MRQFLIFILALSLINTSFAQVSEDKRLSLSEDVLAGLCSGDVSNNNEVDLALSVCSNTELIRNLAQFQILKKQQEDTKSKITEAIAKKEKFFGEIDSQMFFLAINGAGAGISGHSTYRNLQNGIEAYREMMRVRSSSVSQYKAPSGKVYWENIAKRNLKVAAKRGALSGGVSLITILGTIASTYLMTKNFQRIEVAAEDLADFNTELENIGHQLSAQQSKLSALIALKDAIK